MLPHIAFVLGAAALARRTPHAYVSHRSALLGAVQLAFVLVGSAGSFAVQSWVACCTPAVIGS